MGGSEESPATRSTAVRDADRSLVRVHVAERAGQLLFSLLMVLNDRQRYRRPRLQVALFSAAVVESAWMSARLLRRGQYQDRVAMWADTAFAASGLVVCKAGLGGGDGALWMKNLAIGAAHGSSGLDDAADRVGNVAVLGAAAIWCGARARGRDAHVTGLTLGLNDVINWSGQHVAARFHTTAHHRHAVLADEAGRLTVDRAAAAAAEAERTRQHQVLHARTVAVLRELAETDDADVACELARREAARLRHALWSHGATPSTVDNALRDACASVESQQLTIELVTSELTADADPLAVLAVDEVVRRSLLAARDVDGARRAVVRAANDDRMITVTVRHHAGGFDAGGPGGEGLAARGLADGPALLAAVGGTASMWSAPGRGVRMTVTAPVGAPGAPSGRGGGRDQVADPLPESSVGLAAAGHDHGAGGHDDLTRRHVADLAGAAHDDVGSVVVVDDPEAGVPGEAFEPGSQQRLPGNDAGRRRARRFPWVHLPRMTPSADPVVVRSASFSSEDRSGPVVVGLGVGADRADDGLGTGRAIISAFLAYRISGIATGVAAVVAGRGRFRSTRSARIQVAVATVESTWLAARLWRRGGRDVRSSTIDAAVTVAAVVAGRANVAPPDRATFVNWAPWSLGAPAMSGLAMTMPERSPRAVATAATVAAVSSAALSAGRDEFVANASAFVGIHAGAHLLAEQIRWGARRLAVAQAHAVDEGVLLAAERERSRQLRFLHDSALQTLEAIGRRRFADHASVMERAREDAARIQVELDGGSARWTSLPAEVRQLAAHHVRHGLAVDVVGTVRIEPSASVGMALRDACNEALVNVAKHSGTAEASLLVARALGGVEIMVRDDGCGFEAGHDVGFGMNESIHRRLTDVGGRASVESAPGRGTTVVLWGPA